MKKKKREIKNIHIDNCLVEKYTSHILQLKPSLDRKVKKLKFSPRKLRLKT